MKNFIAVFLIFFCLSANAQTVTKWIGPSSGGQWADNANWDNGAPVAFATEIVFDGAVPGLSGGAIAINDVAAFSSFWSFDRLTVKNNAIVTLSTGGNTYLYFTKSFTIEAGSRFNVGDASSGIFIVGGDFSTAINIDGTLDLQGTGAGNTFRKSFEPGGSGSFSNVIATVTGKIILSGPSAVINPGASTLNFESGSQLNVTRDGGSVPRANFKNGSLINVQGVKNGITQFNSSAVYDGVIEWNCPLQAVGGSAAIIMPTSSFNAFDSLVINNTNNRNLRLATNPSGYKVKNLIMNNGGLEFSSPTGSSSYICNIDTLIQTGGMLIGNANGGAFDNFGYVPVFLKIAGKFEQTGGVFDFSNRTPGNTPKDISLVMQVGGDVLIGGTVQVTTDSSSAPSCRIEFNGTGLQSFSATGSFTNNIKTLINNTSVLSGIHCTSNVTLPYTLTFNKGFLYLDNVDFTNPYQVQYTTLNPFSAHVVTNGSGLFIQNVGTAPVPLPIGAAAGSLNPITFAFTSGSQLVGAKVDIGLNPSILFPNIAVNRTWRIKPLGIVPSNLQAAFGYSNFGALGDGNPGFSYTANNEVGINDGTSWQIVSPPGGTAPAAANANTYAQTHLILSSFLLPNVSVPYAVGNLSAVTATGNSIHLQAIRAGNAVLLKWAAEDDENIAGFEIMKSADGRLFETIGKLDAYSNLAGYSFKDINLLSGINYYRLKITGKNRLVKYSVIVAVLNKGAGIVITAILPVLVQSHTAVMLTSALKGAVMLNVTDIQGRVVKRISTNVIAGSNQILIDCSSLAAGAYQLTGYSASVSTNVMRFIKQ